MVSYEQVIFYVVENFLIENSVTKQSAITSTFSFSSVAFYMNGPRGITHTKMRENRDEIK